MGCGGSCSPSRDVGQADDPSMQRGKGQNRGTFSTGAFLIAILTPSKYERWIDITSIEKNSEKGA
jgi:hypothetical protein